MGSRLTLLAARDRPDGDCPTATRLDWPNVIAEVAPARCPRARARLDAVLRADAAWLGQFEAGAGSAPRRVRLDLNPNPAPAAGHVRWSIAFGSSERALLRRADSIPTDTAGVFLVEDTKSGPKVVAFQRLVHRRTDTVERLLDRADSYIPQLLQDALLRLNDGDPGIAGKYSDRDSLPRDGKAVERIAASGIHALSMLSRMAPTFLGGGSATRIVLLHNPPADILDEVLSALRRIAQFVDFEDIATAVAARRAPPPGFAITFDDGCKQMLPLLDVLDKHRCRAMFYVSTGSVADRKPLWFMAKARPYLEAKPRLKRMSYREFSRAVDELGLTHCDDVEWRFGLTAAELRHIASRGHRIGVHTVRHPFLTRLTGEEIRQEIGTSFETLRGILGRDDLPLDVAYPDGDHDEHVVSTLRSMGARTAVTVLPGDAAAKHDPLRLPRYGLGDQDELARNIMRLTGAYYRLRDVAGRNQD